MWSILIYKISKFWTKDTDSDKTVYFSGKKITWWHRKWLWCFASPGKRRTLFGRAYLMAYMPILHLDDVLEFWTDENNVLITCVPGDFRFLWWDTVSIIFLYVKIFLITVWNFLDLFKRWLWRKYWNGCNANENALHTLRKKCPFSELFWSTFCRIWDEYREIRIISPYSVRMRENADQNNSEYGLFSHNDYQWGGWMVHWRDIINFVLLYICLFMNL